MQREADIGTWDDEDDFDETSVETFRVDNRDEDFEDEHDSSQSLEFEPASEEDDTRHEEDPCVDLDTLSMELDDHYDIASVDLEQNVGDDDIGFESENFELDTIEELGDEIIFVEGEEIKNEEELFLDMDAVSDEWADPEEIKTVEMIPDISENEIFFDLEDLDLNATDGSSDEICLTEDV
ncbi:hypothetical protein N9174_00960 [bacterium]|nr:hypothetical protein [bacterium]